MKRSFAGVVAAALLLATDPLAAHDFSLGWFTVDGGEARAAGEDSR